MAEQSNTDTPNLIIGWKLLVNGDGMVSISSPVGPAPDHEGHITPDQADLMAAQLTSSANRARSVKSLNAWIEQHLPEITAEQKKAMIVDLVESINKEDLRIALAPLIGMGNIF